MKKYLLNAISIAFVLALAACKGQTATQPAATMPPVIATTVAPPATDAAPATEAPTDTTAATTDPSAPLPDVTLTIIFAQYCRSNPDIYSSGVGHLEANAEVKAIGRSQDNQYYYIENPDAPGSYCWIWVDYALIDGKAYDLPVIEPTE
jgi:hypothetical protein